MSVASALMSYVVSPRATAPLIYAAVSSTPGAPLNVLTRNVGDGSMDVQWDEPLSGVVNHYDVLVGTASVGPFVKHNRFPITEKNYSARNIPFGYTVYTKVRAVDREGNEGPLSNLADDAQATTPTMQMQFVAPIDDVFIRDSVFTALLNGTLVGVQLDTGVTVTG